MEIKATNINDAFIGILDKFLDPNATNHSVQGSRNGDVLRLNEPLTVTYNRPWQRVLFNAERNCNPFFHLAEAMWMLAGCNDVKYLAQFVPRMKEFSDNGITFHGAYGFRWRYIFNLGDQLDSIIEMLRYNPDTRRAVLQMWDATRDLGIDSKDLPCNTHIYFQKAGTGLDMTVCNRSNDLIWGLAGANMVHFSILHEYMALMTAMPIGRYHHFTTNPHIYIANYPLPALRRMFDCDTLRTPHNKYPFSASLFYYEYPKPADARFYLDLKTYFNTQNLEYLGRSPWLFLSRTFFPMLRTWEAHRAGHETCAVDLAGTIHSTDWRLACESWLQRLYEKRSTKAKKE